MKTLFENWNQYIVEQEGMETSAQTFDLKLPKLRISERWGTPGTDDRKVIEMFTSKIRGATLPEKIASLNSFVADCDKACANTKDVSEILANLVFLDALSSLIYDFNDKTGGFLFESILAALLGGKAEQVPTPGGPNQAIEDLVDSDGTTPLSLKLFFAGPKYIKGSRRNLDVGIEKYKQPIKYIVALKERSGTGDVLAIDFYTFTVGNKKLGFPGDYESWELGSSPGLYMNEVLSDVGKGSVQHYGTLQFGSRDEMKQIAQNYADRLGSVLYEIYDQIDSLSKNVNEYFLEAPQAKESALRAQQNAIQLRKDTEDLT